LLPRVEEKVRVEAKVTVTVVVMAVIVAVTGAMGDAALQAVAVAALQAVADAALQAVADAGTVGLQAGARGATVVIAEDAGLGHPLGEEAALTGTEIEIEAEETETEVEEEIVIETGVEIVIVPEGVMVAGRGAAAGGDLRYQLLIQVQ